MTIHTQKASQASKSISFGRKRCQKLQTTVLGLVYGEWLTVSPSHVILNFCNELINHLSQKYPVLYHLFVQSHCYLNNYFDFHVCLFFRRCCCHHSSVCVSKKQLHFLQFINIMSLLKVTWYLLRVKNTRSMSYKKRL